METAESEAHRRTKNLLRWLLLVAIGGALFVVWRRVFAQPVALHAPPSPRSAPSPIVIPPRPRWAKIVPKLQRWLLFALVTAALTWAMVNIPRPYSIIALVVVVAVALRRPRALAAGAVGLMVASALAFRNVVDFWALDAPVLLMLLGGVALWAAMHRRAPNIPALPAPALSLHRRWQKPHLALFASGVLALAALAWINRIPLEVIIQGGFPLISTDVQFGLLAVGVALIVMGLSAVGLPRRLPSIRWRVVLPVTAIMAFGLALRFWQLNETIRFLVDELFFADIIREQWVRDYLPLLVPFDSVAAEPILFPYWQSLAVDVFGRNFVGLRGASAIIGTLTIGAAYLLGRALFDRKTALLGALLLATFPPHLHFSRIGLSEIAMAFFGTLALAFLARGVMTSRRFDYVLGGAMLGMTHYFHEGGKLFFTPLAALWLGGAMLGYRPRAPARNLLLAVLACALVALPIYSTLLLTQKPLAARMDTNHAGLPLSYWRQLLASGNFRDHLFQHLAPPFLLYVQRADNTLFYAGGTPLMLVFVAPAFLLGVFYALRRWYSPGPMLLVMWVLSASLGNSLLVESSNVARYVVVFPALMLLAAVGIRYTLPLFWPEQENKAMQGACVETGGDMPVYRRLATAGSLQFLLMGILVVGMSAAQVDYYFNQHLPAFNEQFRNSWRHRDAQDAVLRSLDFPPGTQIHIISKEPIPDLTFTRGMLNFMASDLRLIILPMDEFTLKYLAKQKPVRDHAFFVEPNNTAAVALLRERFDALLPVQFSPFDLSQDHQFLLYYAPGET